jgi:hypothetical protein
MKIALLFLAVGLFVLALFFSSTKIWFRETVDINIHDTYVVLSYFHFFLAIFLILGTFFSVGGAIGSRFGNIYFVGLLVLFCAADAFVFWKGHSMFTNL